MLDTNEIFLTLASDMACLLLCTLYFADRTRNIALMIICMTDRWVWAMNAIIGTNYLAMNPQVTSPNSFALLIRNMFAQYFLLQSHKTEGII